jgi:hypothetical protein
MKDTTKSKIKTVYHTVEIRPVIIASPSLKYPIGALYGYVKDRNNERTNLSIYSPLGIEDLIKKLKRIIKYRFILN